MWGWAALVWGSGKTAIREIPKTEIIKNNEKQKKQRTLEKHKKGIKTHGKILKQQTPQHAKRLRKQQTSKKDRGLQ